MKDYKKLEVKEKVMVKGFEDLMLQFYYKVIFET